MNLDSMTSTFAKFFEWTTKNNQQYLEANEIVKSNSQGKAYLIGGFLYQNIASSLYLIPKAGPDLDYLVEKPAEKLLLPKEWQEEKNLFGNPRFVSGVRKINFIPLSNVYSIKARNLEPTVENYMTGTPFTIQAMAYDIKNRELLLTEDCANSIRRRIIEVQDMRMAEHAAAMNKKSIDDLMDDIAAQMQDFRPIYLDQIKGNDMS